MEEEKSYVITPSVDGEWVFTSLANGDTFVTLCDAEGKELAYNDDGGYNSNFMLTYQLKAGESYLVKVRWLRSSSSGYIPVIFEPSVVA